MVDTVSLTSKRNRAGRMLLSGPSLVAVVAALAASATMVTLETQAAAAQNQARAQTNRTNGRIRRI